MAGIKIVVDIRKLEVDGNIGSKDIVDKIVGVVEAVFNKPCTWRLGSGKEPEPPWRASKVTVSYKDEDGCAVLRVDPDIVVARVCGGRCEVETRYHSAARAKTLLYAVTEAILCSTRCGQ